MPPTTTTVPLTTAARCPYNASEGAAATGIQRFGDDTAARYIVALLSALPPPPMSTKLSPAASFAATSADTVTVKGASPDESLARTVATIVFNPGAAAAINMLFVTHTTGDAPIIS